MRRASKRLRERIRVLSGDTEGGASLEDLARGIARRFPELPPLPRTTAPSDPPVLSFDELWVRLEHGHCAVLDGNPVKVADPKSPLRSMQVKDDYDHAVFVHTARASGPSSWTRSVVAATRANGSRRWTCASSRRGSRPPLARRTARSSSEAQESSVERLRREMRERARSLRTELATAKAAVTTARAQALRDAARAIAHGAPVNGG